MPYSSVYMLLNDELEFCRVTFLLLLPVHNSLHELQCPCHYGLCYNL